WRGCGGESSSTTSNSRASSALTTTRAAPGWGGITTPHWSPPRTDSSRSNDCTLFARGRPDTPEGRAAPAAALQVLGRPLPNLPTISRPRPLTTSLHPSARVRPNKALLVPPGQNRRAAEAQLGRCALGSRAGV